MGHKIPYERCIRGLVEVARDKGRAMTAEVDAERAYPPSLLDGNRPVRHRGYGRGVQPAGEQTTQRHVGNDLPLDNVFQQLGDCPDGPWQILVMLMRSEHPVTAFRYSVVVHAHDLSWPHLAHAGVDCGFGILGAHEQLAKAFLVHAWPHTGVRKDRFRLGAE